MNTDVEELLREGMERYTADLRAPAGLTYLVARRRRKRLALRSLTAGAVALAAGAAALAVAVVPSVNGAGGTAVDAAYVIKNVSNALSAAEPGTIAQMTVTTSGPALPGVKSTTTTAEEWSNGNEWRSVTYSSPGHPAYDEGFSTTSGYTLVSYPTKTWARQPGLGQPAAPAFGTPSAKRGCGPAVAGFPDAVPARAAWHEHLRQFAAHDRGHGAAHRGLVRDLDRGRPADRRRNRCDQADEPRWQPPRRDHLGRPEHVPAGARGRPLALRPARSPADRGLHLAAADRAEPGRAHRARPRRIPPGLAPRGRRAEPEADPRRAAAEAGGDLPVTGRRASANPARRTRSRSGARLPLAARRTCAS